MSNEREEVFQEVAQDIVQLLQYSETEIRITLNVNWHHRSPFSLFN